MDLYHKVLLKIYEATGGRDSLAVNLKEIVKDEGFFGSYKDIFQQLSRQGWIAETRRADEVKLTHWGIKEIKNSTDAKKPASDNERGKQKQAEKFLAESKTLAIIAEELKSSVSENNIGKVEKKLKELSEILGRIK